MGRALDQPSLRRKKVFKGVLRPGVSKKGPSKSRKAKGKAIVHIEVKIDLQGTIRGQVVFHFLVGILGEAKMAALQMDIERAELGGSVEME